MKRSVRRSAATAALAAVAFGTPAPAAAEAGTGRPLDAPMIWFDDDRGDVPLPETRVVAVRADQVETTLRRPVRRALRPSHWMRRLAGDHYGAAQNVNALDEVPGSSWFTNRIGLYPTPPADVTRGAGEGVGPDRSGPWTVVSAKTEGVSTGFGIRDATGARYLLKFDSKEHPGIATRAGVVSARILHAAGYNVPDDNVVSFPREQLVLGEGVLHRVRGSSRAMDLEDLETILESVARTADGRYLAISSKLLDGTPVGPFDYKGRRADDPNDRVEHQHRRELRGLRLFAAWLGHFDTKQNNTLDMYVTEDGTRFVKHYLIDFASSLGTGAAGPSPMYGNEYGVDLVQIMGRLVSAGTHQDDWRKIRRPEGLSEVGYFTADRFDPTGAKPLTPNTAFSFMNDQDGYWAAKIISAFREEHLEAAVGAARYEDPAAARYLVETLAARRDVIARKFFSRVAPLDFFRTEGGTLIGRDLGVERGLWSTSETRYRVRGTVVDAERKRLAEWSPWKEAPAPEMALESAFTGGVFHAVEMQVARSGARFGPRVRVYVAPEGRVVAVERAG